jgi:hypothetical protein
MLKIQNKLTLGLISSLLGGLAILLSSGLLEKLGLVQNSLISMSLQAVKCRKWIHFTTKRDIWLSYGVSVFFCTSGGLLITYLLSFTKRLVLLKGFFLGTVGGLIPYVFKRYKLIRDFKKPIDKVMSIVSHGFFGLTVALIVRSLGDYNRIK